MEKIKKFLKTKEFWILVAILSISAFLRLNRIGDYMTFLGDEGRDVIIVRRFLTEFHPPLIGAGTSIGNMYLGPLYYYMMAPALLIANFSPIGPAIEIAILGVITVWFVWFVTREWFPGDKSNWGALIAAFLYGISPTVINFSRSSWNPNIMPFFALLSIYSIWKVYASREVSHEVGCWLMTLGVSFAFVLQSHYLGLLLAPTLFIFWLKSRPPIRYTLIAIGLFLFLMSPLLIFDLRHNFQNFNAIRIFFSSSHDIGFSFSTYISRFTQITVMLFTNLVGVKNLYLGIVAIVISLILVILVIKKKIFKGPYSLLFLWLLMGLIGLAYYKGAVYDHYLGFLFPVPFLIVGSIIQTVFNNKKLIPKILVFVITIYISIISFQKDPPITHATFQMPRAISVAKVIQEKSGGKRFNLATISDFNNRDVYEYFLLIWGTKIVDTDPSSLQFTVTDQLFVVCEKPRDMCDPVHNASAWITNFGWTKIEDEWPVWGGTLFKLGHTK